MIEFVDELARSIEAAVLGLGLDRGSANSLLVKIQGVSRALIGGNTASACSKLQAFINEVEAQAGPQDPRGGGS